MLKDIKFLNVYYPGKEDIGSFYLDCLLNSINLKLCLGFFSTSGFKALSPGFSYFLYNGGNIKFIINNILSIKDKNTISEGQSPDFKSEIEDKLIKNIILLEKTLNKKDKFFFKCVSWLISNRRIEIIVVIPRSNIGISHHKFGIFSDKNDSKVAFTGSANFSQKALEYNLENLVAFTSWENKKEEETVDEFESYFDKIWNKKEESLIYIPIDKVKTAIYDTFPTNKIGELIEEENEISERITSSKSISKSFKKKVKELRKKIYTISGIVEKSPNLPAEIELREYQKKAYSNWFKDDCQGLFEMATGTGKTVTALNCAIKIYNNEGKINILILVPTITLISQWKEELENCNFENIILAYSDNKDWYEQCLRSINKNKLFGDYSFCILSTYKTFVKNNFYNMVKKFPKDLLLIADEVHNMGANNIVKKLPFNIEKRIALTATPTRYFDEEGTKKILDFFNSSEKPTIKFDLSDAINHGYLCKYYYFPRIVTLLPDELDEYKDISKKLMKYFDKKTGKFVENDNVTRLFIARKRIIHKAKNKIDIFKEILNELIEKSPNLKYTLVYVPEGADKNDDLKLINEFSKIVAFNYKLKQHQYIDKTKNKKEILDKFSKGELQVLTSMKCLDEGVDIKKAEIAIFCASTGNPRQFIQRRGRILRTHKDKKFAKIYDMIVIPYSNYSNLSDLQSMEKTIIEKELIRVYEFANIAENKYAALKHLDPIMTKFGINIF